ncbi:hypothetical protein ACIP6Q_11095 [Streptomyces bobili]|uniref:hypothetical protein n=1 Tax=Streptomyces bobili TaxID=67280 RepID=UPI00382D0FD3
MSRAGITRGEGAAALRVFTPGARPAETHGHLLSPAGDEPERARFIDLLPTAREPGSRLRERIAVRVGFYARCGEHAELANALSRAGCWSAR